MKDDQDRLFKSIDLKIKITLKLGTYSVEIPFSMRNVA